MPYFAAKPCARAEDAPGLVTDIASLTLVLSDVEYEAAAILTFDPEATLAPGALLANGCGDGSVHMVAGNCFPIQIWRQLARACTRWTPHHDDTARLAEFLAERTAMANLATQAEDLSTLATDADLRTCAICDGGPGNDCACWCGARKFDPAPAGSAILGSSPGVSSNGSAL
ncbi:MAG: hypothetical protein JHC57_08015 [Sphingopyxis sp.]|uniref:hypothetical protein n=1 Tax=Sphingopyxis sp. TaxID=1908224 RepID=UPI001A313484|nr:hypothetical protein [Sphingopyxis sp.]MBJ7499682.1 hypothetical protein [Sphingopyxis sp.]